MPRQNCYKLTGHKLFVFFKLFLSVVHLFVCTFKNQMGVCIVFAVKASAAGCDSDIAFCIVDIHSIIKFGKQAFTVILIIAFEYRNKFVTADTIDRTVFETVTYYITGILYIFVTSLMTLCVIYDLEIIQVKYNYCKF